MGQTYDSPRASVKVVGLALTTCLQGQFLAAYPSSNWILAIEDISEFVQEQRQNIRSDCKHLIVPTEKVYPVLNCVIAQKLQLSTNL